MNRDVLIRELADGEIHSGTALGAKMNVSRTAVWKQLRRLGEVGLDVEAVPGRGYRFARRLDLLNRRDIEDAIDGYTAAVIDSFDLGSVVDSTNDCLRDRAPPAPGRMHVMLAEFQTGGRGRQGRQWLSPYGSGLCLSVAWAFDAAPPGFPALGLAAGVAVHRALSAFGAPDLALKWPNDIVCDDRKLAGLLVDVSGESNGPIDVVTGVGINVDMTKEFSASVVRENGMTPVGLGQILGSECPSRNQLAAAVISSLHAALAEFAVAGFSGVAAEWRRHDALTGRRIQVHTGACTRDGIACGVDDDGALLIDSGGTRVPVVSGDVTVRAT